MKCVFLFKARNVQRDTSSVNITYTCGYCGKRCFINLPLDKETPNEVDYFLDTASNSTKCTGIPEYLN